MKAVRLDSRNVGPTPRYALATHSARPANSRYAFELGFIEQIRNVNSHHTGAAASDLPPSLRKTFEASRRPKVKLKLRTRSNAGSAPATQSRKSRECAEAAGIQRTFVFLAVSIV
jgi:hypothetical protein